MQQQKDANILTPPLNFLPLLSRHIPAEQLGLDPVHNNQDLVPRTENHTDVC